MQMASIAWGAWLIEKAILTEEEIDEIKKEAKKSVNAA